MTVSKFRRTVTLVFDMVVLMATIVKQFCFLLMTVTVFAAVAALFFVVFIFSLIEFTADDIETAKNAVNKYVTNENIEEAIAAVEKERKHDEYWVHQDYWTTSEVDETATAQAAEPIIDHSVQLLVPAHIVDEVGTPSVQGGCSGDNNVTPVSNDKELEVTEKEEKVVVSPVGLPQDVVKDLILLLPQSKTSWKAVKKIAKKWDISSYSSKSREEIYDEVSDQAIAQIFPPVESGTLDGLKVPLTMELLKKQLEIVALIKKGDRDCD
ncbi:MAG: hypothetical protein WBB28_01845 [Crinalium sp.]